MLTDLNGSLCAVCVFACLVYCYLKMRLECASEKRGENDVVEESLGNKNTNIKTKFTKK